MYVAVYHSVPTISNGGSVRKTRQHDILEQKAYTINTVTMGDNDVAGKEAAPALAQPADDAVDTSKETEKPPMAEKPPDKAEQTADEKEKPSRASDAVQAKDASIAASSTVKTTTTTAPTAPPRPRPPVSAPPQPRGPIVVSLPPVATTATTAVSTTQQKRPAPTTVPLSASKPSFPASAATAKPTFAKKRKLSTSPTPVLPPPRPAVTSQQRPLVDPAVTKTVHDVMGLLQTCTYVYNI